MPFADSLMPLQDDLKGGLSRVRQTEFWQTSFDKFIQVVIIYAIEASVWVWLPQVHGAPRLRKGG
jgi:hypothetical protein